MSLKSYGRCEQCKTYAILNCFWYNGVETTPWYLCDDCMAEFDKAMEDSANYTLYGVEEEQIYD